MENKDVKKEENVNDLINLLKKNKNNVEIKTKDGLFEKVEKTFLFEDGRQLMLD